MNARGYFDEAQQVSNYEAMSAIVESILESRSANCLAINPCHRWLARFTTRLGRQIANALDWKTCRMHDESYPPADWGACEGCGLVR